MFRPLCVPTFFPLTHSRLAGACERRTGPWTHRLRTLSTAAIHAVATGILCALWLPGIAEAVAQTPLEFADALRLAEARAPQVAAQEHAVRAATEMAAAAGELPDPKLRLGVENLPIETADRWSFARDGMTMRRIGLMQEFPGMGKRVARAERAGQMRDRELAGVAVTRALIRRDVATAWLERWLAERTLATLRELATEGEAQVRVVTSGVAGGRVQAPDVIAARTSLVMVQDRITDAERDVTKSIAMLERFLGEEAKRPLSGPPDLGRLAPEVEGASGLGARRPELALAEREVDVARAEAKLAGLAKHPDWSLEISYGQRGNSFGNMVSVMLSVDLPLFPESRQGREEAAKLARVDELAAQREALARVHEAEVKGLLADWSAVGQKLERFERDILPLARERLWATTAAYAAGRVEIAMVLDARSGYADALVQQLGAERERARVWAQIHYLTIPGTPR